MGAERLRGAFAGRNGVPAFVAFITAGFPRRDVTVPAMLAMQEEGVSVIEASVSRFPFERPRLPARPLRCTALTPASAHAAHQLRLVNHTADRRAL